jgi:hypothetical protein
MGAKAARWAAWRLHRLKDRIGWVPSRTTRAWLGGRVSAGSELDLWRSFERRADDAGPQGQARSAQARAGERRHVERRGRHQQCRRTTGRTVLAGTGRLGLGACVAVCHRGCLIQRSSAVRRRGIDARRLVARRQRRIDAARLPSREAMRADRVHHAHSRPALQGQGQHQQAQAEHAGQVRHVGTLTRSSDARPDGRSIPTRSTRAIPPPTDRPPLQPPRSAEAASAEASRHSPPHSRC